MSCCFFLQDFPVYSCDEKALMAEILRDDQLNERREKARCVDFKLHDAKLRRMFRAAQAEALKKERSISIYVYIRQSVRPPVPTNRYA